MKNVKNLPLVLIEWIDSRGVEGRWVHVSNFEIDGICKCLSVGWLMHDGDDFKAVAANIGDEEDDDNIQVCGVMRIPACAVISITELNFAEE